jgi:cytosine/adenosine deaminase-related metal-dependent hydrolase
VSSSFWQKIAAASVKQKLPLHGHLAQSLEEWQRAKTLHGVSPTEYLERLGVLASHGDHQLFAHGIFADATDLRRLAHGRQTLAFCPFSALIFAFPANLMAWEEARLRWVVATDCAASNDSMNVQKELRAVSGFPLQQLSYAKPYQQFIDGQASSPAALQPLRRQIWDASTKFREPSWLLAKVWDLPGTLHPQVNVGRLQAGYLANLLVWNTREPALWPGTQLRSIAFGDSSSSIHALMVAGQWVGTGGNFARSLVESTAYQEAEEEARRRLEEVMRKLNK